MEAVGTGRYTGPNEQAMLSESRKPSYLTFDTAGKRPVKISRPIRLTAEKFGQF